MESNRLTLDGTVDPAGRMAVESLLQNDTIASAWYGQSVQSTNSLALEQAASGLPLAVPRLVLTDEQTAGRGRRGRSWLSSDQTLTFSLILATPEEPKDINWLSLAVGVGIARCLEFEFAPLVVRLKWPNDVYIGGGKVAGNLLETAANQSNYVIIGVGLNVGAPPDISNSEDAPPVCSINESTGRSLKRYDCFVSLLEHLVATLMEPESLIDEFRARCMLSDQMISFHEEGIEREGRCVGIDDHGELVVALDHGTRVLRSGEVRLIRQRNNQ